MRQWSSQDEADEAVSAVDKIRGHEFMPEDLIIEAPAMGSTEDDDDPIVFASFFHPMSGARWLATEYSHDEGLFFGYAEMFPGGGEFGYFSLYEIATVVAGFYRDDTGQVRGLPVERDCHFTPAPLSEVKARLGLD